MISSQLPFWKLAHQRVLVRIDGNVPFKNGTIFDDFRLQQITPTIDYLIGKEALVFIVTHIGRPQTNTAEFSTQQLIPWFTQRNYTITFASTIAAVKTLQCAGYTGIILLENIRFFPGETSGDSFLARQLAACADYFVNDAFGVMHKTDASITTIGDFFLPTRKTCGFLVEKELQKLMPLIAHHDKKQLLLILGGAKISEKIKYLKGLINLAHTILLCPALVFSFLKAQGKEVGTSLIDETLLELCAEILTYAQEKKTTILMPSDYQVQTDTAHGKSLLQITDSIQHNQYAISIGPTTIAKWNSVIQKSPIILFNGLFGFEENPTSLHGINSLMQAITDSQATTIITGGDSVAYVRKHHFAEKISLLSSGGGATLAFLSTQSLPGITALLKNGTKA